MTAPFPILFITADTVGGAILSSGLIKRLHDEIDYARFTIAGGPSTAPLFADMPRFDGFIPLPERPLGLHWMELMNQARGKRWGLVVDTRGAPVSRMIPAKKHAIYAPPPAEGPPLHAVEDLARILKLEDEPPAPYLFVSEETERNALELVGEGRPILAVGPGAQWAGKAWPAERFNQIAARLLGPDGDLEDGRLMVLGSEADRETAQTVRFAVPRERVIDLAGKTDLLTAYACLRQARLFLGNDTELMHLAAAAGAPTIGLFGPSDETRSGPWGGDARALRGPRSYQDFRAVDPKLNQAVNHMLDLPVAKVMASARELLRLTEPAE